MKALLEGGGARPEVAPMSAAAHGPPRASGPVAGGALAGRGAGLQWAGGRGGRGAGRSACIWGVCVCPRGVSGGGGAWRVLVSAARVVAGAPCWERLALGVGVRGRALLVVSSQHRSASSRKPFVWGGGSLEQQVQAHL